MAPKLIEITITISSMVAAAIVMALVVGWAGGKLGINEHVRYVLAGAMGALIFYVLISVRFPRKKT